MESAFPTGYGMSVIVGLTESKLSQLVNSLYSEREPIFVSNINTPLQMTVSGSNSALERLETAAGKIGARKAERLRVSVPSHCPLYEQAASVLEHAITSIAMKESRIPYISNIKARPLREPRAIGVDLARNIANPVRWHDSLCVLEELGTELFVEVNPGDILTKLATEAFPLRRAISLDRSSLAYLLKLTKLEPKQ
jgi:malonate decarboxylase epsilon subunit